MFIDDTISAVDLEQIMLGELTIEDEAKLRDIPARLSGLEVWGHLDESSRRKALVNGEKLYVCRSKNHPNTWYCSPRMMDTYTLISWSSKFDEPEG